MNEPETEMTEQSLTAPAVQPEAAAPAEPLPLAETPAAEPEPNAAPPLQEEPRVDNQVPLKRLEPTNDGQGLSSQEFEMLASGLRPEQLRSAPSADVPDPEGQGSELASAPEAGHESRDTEGEQRRAAMEAYWKTALTGNPDTIPDSFRARAASADITSTAEESEYDLLSAVNRSWYADHSEMSREKIAAEWPRIRAELTEKYGMEDNERELFTALSVAPEEEARRDAAKKAYETAYRASLLGEEREKRAPWTEEKNPWRSLEEQAREEAAKLRRELLPDAKTLNALFATYDAMEKGMPWEALAPLWEAPEMAELCRRMVQMEPEKRQALYDITLKEQERAGGKPGQPENLYIAFRRSLGRGVMNLDMGVAQLAGNLTAAAANLAARTGLAEGGREVARTTDAYMQLMEELRSVAQERRNPIHTEGESLARKLFLDVAEATPAAIVSMTGAGGLALASASGVGSSLAEVRQRASEGDISLQTAAGVVGFGAQIAVSEMFARGGGRAFEAAMGRFVRERLAGATGSFTLKALGAGGRMGKETFRNLFDNRTGRGVELLMQEGAAQMEGVASNIDWKEYGQEYWNVELNVRDAFRSLPYILIGAGRASLHHFRDPHALVADGTALREWGVPEETQRRLMTETDPRKQNRLLYDALHNGTRWGGVGFLQDAALSLRLLHTDTFQPFHEKDVVRDFLQLPGETEVERARRLTLGDPRDPAYMKKLAEKHAAGQEIKDPKKAMPFLLMTEAWTQRAFPEDMQGYLRPEDLAPPELVKIGDYSPETEKARAAALNKTVRYLDALTYRLLLDSTSFGSLTLSGRKPQEVGAEMDALRHKLFGKVAESVVARAGGAPPSEAAGIFGQFLTDYYADMRYSDTADSWIRFAPRRYLAQYHTRALTARGLNQGFKVVPSRYPELVKSYRVPQGLYFCMESLVNLIGHQEDFRTSLARGMTPQEAYVHLLHRELGERLQNEDWVPRNMAEDATDRTALHEENRQMTELYSRITGNELESREGDDGRTYWRIRKPDRHYTRWHDSEAACINDLAADCRVRFLTLGGNLPDTVFAAHDTEGRYDAARIGQKADYAYSYFDRLSARATGDMIRFWQEDAAMAVPGAVVEPYNGYISRNADTSQPLLKENSAFPGSWVIDTSGVRTPYGLMHGRFQAYWLNQLNSGWLKAADATDFLTRRGAIDETEREKILKRGRSLINGQRSHYSMEEFLEGSKRALPTAYRDTAGMNGLLSQHLADYTASYFMGHLNEIPMPQSAREWFALSSFRFRFPLFKENNDRLQKGRNGTEQVERWTHQYSAQRMAEEMRKVERYREHDKQGQPLQDDPLFPLLREAIVPAPHRSAEQGWMYSLGGAHALLRVQPEAWNLLQEPVKGWSLLDPAAQEKVHRALGGKPTPEGETPAMPKALEELDAALKTYPDLHRFAPMPGEESRLVEMTIPRKSTAGYERFDSIYDHPTHEGDRIIHGGFRLQEPRELPAFLRDNGTAASALRTLDTLRRSALDSPYADAQGVWWRGELYGGKNGRKIAGMDDSWYATEPLANIRRLFREMPEDGSPVMTFGDDISFGRRDSLPDEAFLGTTVYRSPDFPLSQIRLMPGERESVFRFTRHPYVTHSFIAAPMQHGRLTANKDSHAYYFYPLEDFDGDVTRELIGHMAGWWGKMTVKNSLEMLMDRTESPEQLRLSRHEDISNRELLMQLSEDCRFSASLEGRAPHELTPEEALAATWLHALAEFDTGTNLDKASADLLRIHRYFKEHPERLEAVEAMLKDHRVWYELDPNDQWYHVVTSSHEIRHAKRIREYMERREDMERLRRHLKSEEEVDAIFFAEQIGKKHKQYKRDR